MINYETVDVFCDQPFAGNPLAVVFGADGLADSQLGALAREFNYSETVFVLPPTTPEATYRVRIFTPARELPFAGHPSIGAAVTMLRRGSIEPGKVIQECGAGLLPLTVCESGTATLTGARPEVGHPLDPVPLLHAVGLEPGDLVGPAARMAGCGSQMPFLSVTPEAVRRAGLRSGTDLDHLCLFSWNPESATARVRVFAPGAGVVEDPATGSAALGLGAWLVAVGLLPGEGTSGYTIHQGLELGRPSVLRGTISAVGGQPVLATVTGQVIPIARGQMVVPESD